LDNLEKAKLLIAEKDEELRKKEEEIAQLRERLGDVEQTVVVPTESQAEFEEKVATLEKKIAEMEAEKTQLIENIKAEQLVVITEKDKHIAHVVEELETARNDLRDAKNRIQELGEKEEEIKVAYLENQLSLLSDPDRLALPPPSSPKPRLDNVDETAKAQIRSLETKLQLANQSFRNSEAERQKCEQINRDTMKRVMQLESENGRLKGITEELSAKLRDSASVQVLEEKDARIRDLADERSRLQWRIGELSQWWSDAKWKIGELEAGVAHHRHMLDTANGKIQNLNDQLATALRASMCLAKGNLFPLIKLSFQLQGTADLIDNGSFLNWQCALKCDPIGPGKRGLMVDLPRGRHEFRFLVDGNWMTSSSYSKVPNGFGGDNNLLWIE
uniref:AMPK1_CBM domain-containing protein n=1 Tax=Heligmosomoides polygyrus TaxID=6339 RepID=A0A183FUJ7_HELPZ